MQSPPPVPTVKVPLPPRSRSLTFKLWLFCILISALGVMLVACFYLLGWIPFIHRKAVEQIDTLRLPANETLVDARWTNDDRLTYTSRLLDPGEAAPRRTTRILALVDRNGAILRKMLVIEGVEPAPASTLAPLPKGLDGNEGEPVPRRKRRDQSDFTF